MKSFLTSLLSFLVLGIFFYVFSLIFAGQYLSARWKTNLNYTLPGNGYLYTRLKEADTTDNVDVLILGSSKAYLGYDIRIFEKHNYKAFNLGSPGQSFIQTEFLINRYINRFKPKFIIFDIYPTLFNDNGVASGLNVVSNAKFDFDVLTLALKQNNVRIYNTLIYSIYRQIFWLKNSYKEPMEKEYGKYIKAGYVELYKTSKLNENVEGSDVIIKKEQLVAFINIIQVIKAHKIPYVLIQSPMIKSRFNSFRNNKELDSLISKHGKYYNFNHLISIPNSEYSDEIHLNQYGVNRFNKQLLDTLDIQIRKYVNYKTL